MSGGRLFPALTVPGSPPVVELAPPVSAADLAPARAAGWQVVELDGAACGSKGALLDALASAWRFPAWAGRNWDALADLLRDLSWCPAPGYLFVWHRPEVLAAADPAAFAVALDIARSTSAFWEGEGVRFATVLAVAPGAQIARPAPSQ